MTVSFLGMGTPLTVELESPPTSPAEEAPAPSFPPGEFPFGPVESPYRMIKYSAYFLSLFFILTFFNRLSFSSSRLLFF